MQVYMLSLFFFGSVYRTIEIGTLYFAGLDFLENFFPVLYFGNFLIEFAKITKYFKDVEIKIFNLSLRTKKFYRTLSAAFYFSI